MRATGEARAAGTTQSVVPIAQCGTQPQLLQSSRQLGLHGRRMATVSRLGFDGASMPLPTGVSATPSHGGMPPPPPRAPSARAIAGSLNLLGPIGGGSSSLDRWMTEPTRSERAALDALRWDADFRIHHFTEERRSTHLVTALNWFARFLSTLPSRVPFVPYASSGDIQSAAYNEETFRLFAEFIRKHGSVRPGFAGMLVSATAISDYISAIRAFVSRETGYNLLLQGGNLRLPRQVQHMRREDGPAGQRQLSRGLTARILRRLLDVPGFTSALRAHCLRWALLWVGHNLMWRGGEAGTTDGKAFSPITGITISDVDWVEPCRESDMFAVSVVDMMPIKDTYTSRSRIPCLIRRCSQAPTSRLPTQPTPCAWEALRRWWLMRTAEVHPSEWANAPLFAHTDGSAVSTTDVRVAIRQAASAAGENADDFDARALRIGGATDLYHILGDAGEAERVIQKRGRWCSMIHDIYARISASSMMTVSAALPQADGVDLEAFRHGYVMPAVVYRGRLRGGT